MNTKNKTHNSLSIIQEELEPYSQRPSRIIENKKLAAQELELLQGSLEKILNLNQFIYTSHDETTSFNPGPPSSQSKKRKIEEIGQYQQSNLERPKRRKLNPRTYESILERKQLMVRSKRQLARMNSEERELFLIQKECKKAKEEYEQWKQFYISNVKKQFECLKEGSHLIPQLLNVNHKRKARTPTKIRPFIFEVDRRAKYRQASCQPNQTRHFNLDIHSRQTKRRSFSADRMKAKKFQSQKKLKYKLNRRKSSSLSSIAFKEFRLMTEERSRYREMIKESLQEQRHSLDSGIQRFRARKMPDFSSITFIPLLNEKPLTFPQGVELEVDKRASIRKILNESKSKPYQELNFDQENLFQNGSNIHSKQKQMMTSQSRSPQTQTNERMHLFDISNYKY